MTEAENHRLQELFLAALEVPGEQREAWLIEQCGDDAQLLADVHALLDHDEPTHDPLEQGLDAALGGIPSTLVPNSPITGDVGGHSETEAIIMDSQLFLSKLTDVGVLSPEELKELSDTVAEGQSDSDPRKLASQLVSDGKLTEYQASALLSGKPDLLLDKYLILDLIGAGGMGMVFKAIHRPMSRTVAIKMISQQLLSSPEQVKRFQREVRVAATLEHPHIVRAYDADQANGVHFLVLEYVRGETLAQTIRRDGPLSLESAVDAIVQAARGLGYAHEQGIVHRDVKPANLMRNTRGTVKVLDLGLADVDESFRLVQQSSAAIPGGDATAHDPSTSDLTPAGAVLGTVSYMAPEQSLKAAAADARSDVYALGCTLYYLLTGEPPYSGESVFEVFAQHRDGEIPSLRTKRPDVPAAVEAVCHRMLAKASEDRYQSMEELIAALQACGVAAPEDAAKPASGQYQQVTRATATDTRPLERSDRHQSAWRTWAILLLVLIGGSYAMSLLMGPWIDQDRPRVTEVDDTPADDQATLAQGDRQETAVRNEALRFDGGHIMLPAAESPRSQAITWEGWVSYSEEGPLGKVFGIEGGNHLVHLQREGGRLTAILRMGNQRLVSKYRGPVPPGRPHHVALVAGQGRLALFVNGEKSESVQIPHDFEIRVLPQTISQPNNQTNNLHGTLDEIRFSSVARYSEDFTPAIRFEPDEHTVALYHCDGTGNTLLDSSGNGYHVDLSGLTGVSRSSFDDQETRSVSEGPTTVASQESNEASTHAFALEFDGGGDYVNLPDLGFLGQRPVTLEAWYEASEIIKSGSGFLLLDNYMWVEFTEAGGWRIVTRDGKSGYIRSTLKGKQITGRPVHFAVEFDGTTFRAFVDGRERKLVHTRLSQSSGKWQEMPVSGEITLIPMKGKLKSVLGIHPVTGKQAMFRGRLIAVRYSLGVRYSEDFKPARQFEADESTLVLYHIDEGQGDVLHDSSGNGYHGTIVGPKWVRVESDFSVPADPSAADLLATGEWEWRSVERLPKPINSDGAEKSGDMSADGLTIVFASYRGGYGECDLWMATRPDVASPWSNPVNLGEAINTSGRESDPALSHDALTLVFQRHQETFITRRTSLEAEWSAPVPYDMSSNFSPEPGTSRIGRVLQKHHTSETGIGSLDLFMSVRSGAGAPWPSPVRLPEPINTDEQEGSATLSEDGRLLIYHRWSKEEKTQRLWMTTRSNWNAPWSEPTSIDSIAAPTQSSRARLLPDGKTLLYKTFHEAPPHDDLYLARLVRKNAPVEPIKGLEDSEQAAAVWEWPDDAPAPAIAPFDAEQAERHQREWAEHLDVEVETTNSIGLKMRLIPPGEFLMGSSQEEIEDLTMEAQRLELASRYGDRIPLESPRHQVTLTQPFVMSVNEVSRGQFRKFVEATGYLCTSQLDGKGGMGFVDGKQTIAPQFAWDTQLGNGQTLTDFHPVTNVSWTDAMAFCKWLSTQENATYTLPSEAQWEFACRAGTESRFSYGTDLGKHELYATSKGNRLQLTGAKQPNPFGMHDMHGNVWEICRDWRGPYTATPVIDPIGQTKQCVKRGGGANFIPSDARSAQRNLHYRDLCQWNDGFRIVRVLPRQGQPRQAAAEQSTVDLLTGIDLERDIWFRPIRNPECEVKYSGGEFTALSEAGDLTTKLHLQFP